ncbi:MAG: hypothetical protein AAF494_03610 [Pseudomonadota bacterium]
MKHLRLRACGTKVHRSLSYLGAETAPEFAVTARRERPTQVGLASIAALAMVAAAGGLSVPPLAAQQPQQQQGAVPTYYTINGQPAPIELQQLMMLRGFTPGDYYIDKYGNVGMVGQPPIINLDGGPPRTSGPLVMQNNGSASAQAPAQPGQPAQPPQARGAGNPQLENQIIGSRIYWAFNSRRGHGGGSGYYHLCPGNYFHRSAESSFRVGGDYNIRTESYNAGAAGAAHASNAGNWRVEQTQQGMMVRMVAGDGQTWEFLLSNVQNGRWRHGQTKFFVERGKASC